MSDLLGLTTDDPGPSPGDDNIDSSNSDTTTSASASTSTAPLLSSSFCFTEISNQEATGQLVKLFPDEDQSAIHHHSVCIQKSCCRVSKGELLTQSSLKNKFKHEWLLDKEIAYSAETGIWWLIFVEGKWMYCLLC